jgi:hypothetical protein
MSSVLVRAIIAVCALVWVLLLVLAGTVEASRELFAPYTLVVAVAGGLVWLYDTWLWRVPPVTWLLRRPDLRGTWRTEIRSDWVNPETGAKVPPIAAFMCITQTASTLHLRQFTAESVSVTRAAAFAPEEDGAHSLAAVYHNDPRSDVRHRSAIHYGGMRLRVTGRDTLEGDYWTDRKTSGRLMLHRISHKKSRSFAEASAMTDFTAKS